MSYISLSEKDKKDMLAAVGVNSAKDLFSCIPDEIRLKGLLNLPAPASELEVLGRFDEIAGKNTSAKYLSFLGGGAYSHFIPSVVDSLSSRGEFVSPYTPYQPEVSQGSLQVIFEYQTLVCQLTGMDISNASLYDGATGAAEAALMAFRLKGKPRALIARSLHPQYRHVIRTYIKNLGIRVEEIAYDGRGGVDLDDLRSKVDDRTSVVITQSPNFFGVCEDVRSISDIAHGKQALSSVVVAEALSLGMLEAPGKLGADIVTGEAQSFGIPLGFGGPYLGFMACLKGFVRQMPGRIAGQTKDIEGARGYVLTLATREQHIRRENATSNICTNHALCALRATVFLETLGKEGLREMARQNVQKANYAVERLTAVKGVRRKFEGGVFNEFVCEFPKDWEELSSALKEKGILGGIGLAESYPELRRCALICVTEKHTRAEIDRFAAALEEVLR